MVKYNISQDIKTCPYSHISRTYKILENLNFVQIHTMAISKKLSNLKACNTSDVLDMDTALFKLVSNPIASSVTHIYNLSLYHGVIPNDLKIACVTPVFKNKANRSDISNYRPISVISHIGKILEDVVKT